MSRYSQKLFHYAMQRIPYMTLIVNIDTNTKVENSRDFIIHVIGVRSGSPCLSMTSCLYQMVGLQ